MKVLIVEDEAPAYRRLQRLLEQVRPDCEIVEVLDTIHGAIDYFESKPKLDLIFMDIQLADGLSFEIFEAIEIETPIIFTTAYNEFALKAFEVNSIDYLLKPIDEKDLDKAITKWEKYRQINSMVDIKDVLKQIQPEDKAYKQRFLVKKRDQLKSIDTKDIAYWLLDHGNVWLHTQDAQKYSYDKVLDDIEQDLDPRNFFRLNRQCIANINAVKSASIYDKNKLLVHLSPEAEKPLVVSRDKASDFKKWMDFN